MERRLLELSVENFRSLRQVTVPLGPLNVLVGPNGAGKTNLLEVFRFLADVINTDLEPAIDARGGFEQLLFRGGETVHPELSIGVKALWTENSSSEQPDSYHLHIVSDGDRLHRREEFAFQRVSGRVHRVAVDGQRVDITDTSASSTAWRVALSIGALATGLSTLPRLSDSVAGGEVAAFARRLASLRVLDIEVNAARRATRFSARGSATLGDDAANLAGFLRALSSRAEHAWEQLVSDACEVLPQLDGIGFEYPSGAGREVVVVLHERGIRGATQLADASYGTIRLLGLLAALHDPAPAALTCVEEIDHGLHPQALELVVERLREASERTQLIVATHSPALANRLRPDELIICERGDDGSSVIPALSVAEIEEIVEASGDLPLGELWFSGALGGDL